MEYAEVASVCDKLFEQGYGERQISFSRVRAVLGKGDKGGLLAHIKTWKAEHATDLEQRDTPPAIPVPAELTAMMAHALATAVADATSQLKLEYSQAVAESEKRDEDFAQALEDIAHLKEELRKERDAHAETRGKVGQLQTDLTAVRDALECAETRRKELEAGELAAQDALAAKDALDQQVHNLNKSISDLNGRLAEAQEWKGKYDQEHTARLAAEARGARLEEVSEQLKKSQQQCADIQAQAKEDASYFRKALTKAQDQAERLNGSLDRAEDARRGAEKKSEESERALKAAQGKVAELEKALADALQENEANQRAQRETKEGFQ